MYVINVELEMAW